MKASAFTPIAENAFCPTSNSCMRPRPLPNVGPQTAVQGVQHVNDRLNTPCSSLKDGSGIQRCPVKTHFLERRHAGDDLIMLGVKTLPCGIPGRWRHHALQTNGLGVTPSLCSSAPDGIYRGWASLASVMRLASQPSPKRPTRR